MSAITGIFYRNDNIIHRKLIKKMNDSLSHRGPDCSAIWVDNNIALGHQMLWTTPESVCEKLPFNNEKAGLVITADARLDNREELSKIFDINNKEDISDSYFILKSYEKWGEKCTEHLLGDFAFAIWDKNEKRLFCVRDHMGVKPFYYYISNEIFVFSTEIKAILSIPDLSHELNKKRLALFLMANDSFENEYTFYKHIKSLPSANYLTIDALNFKNKKYWKLNANSQIILDSDEDYAKTFLEIFTEAVRCRMRSRSPIGVMLSGGLDSSSVACIANKILIENDSREKIHSFSYIYDDYPDIDERHYIEQVLDKGGFDPHFIICDEINPLDRIEYKMEYYDQPLSSYQISVIHESRKMINENGVSVLLTGEGGDQIVSQGTNYLEELLVTFQWQKLINNIKYISDIRKLNKYKLLLYTIFRVVNYYTFNWPIISYMFDKDYKILNNEFFRHCNLNKILDELNIMEKSYNITNSKETHYHLIEIQHQLGFEMLDQDTRNYCIDTRHPFYDKRLIEFCYSIPNEIKLKFGFGRYVCRIAMEGILPEEIQWRSTKSKMGIVGASNFLHQKKIIESVIKDKDKTIKEYIDSDKLQDAFRISTKNKASKSTIYLWRATLFYFWLLNKKKL